jgi:hypothetical protein
MLQLDFILQCLFSDWIFDNTILSLFPFTEYLLVRVIASTIVGALKP